MFISKTVHSIEKFNVPENDPDQAISGIIDKALYCFLERAQNQLVEKNTYYGALNPTNSWIFCKMLNLTNKFEKKQDIVVSFQVRFQLPASASQLISANDLDMVIKLSVPFSQCASIVGKMGVEKDKLLRPLLREIGILEASSVFSEEISKGLCLKSFCIFDME